MRTCNCEQAQELRKQLETERQRLAGCGVAALGYFDGCHPDYDSASLQDVLRLREKSDKSAILLVLMLPQVGVHSRLAQEVRDLLGLEL